MLALVIDDSRTMRAIVGGIVGELGFDVVEAGDGREALDWLESTSVQPDLMLVDWNMPVMDGLTFVQSVRKDGRWSDATIVMVTTEANEDQIVRALAAGAHDYVIKPFTPESITEKLNWLGLAQQKVAQ